MSYDRFGPPAAWEFSKYSSRNHVLQPLEINGANSRPEDIFRDPEPVAEEDEDAPAAAAAQRGTPADDEYALPVPKNVLPRKKTVAERYGQRQYYSALTDDLKRNEELGHIWLHSKAPKKKVKQIWGSSSQPCSMLMDFPEIHKGFSPREGFLRLVSQLVGVLHAFWCAW